MNAAARRAFATGCNVDMRKAPRPIVVISLALASASNTATAATPTGRRGATAIRDATRSAGLLRKAARRGATRSVGDLHAAVNKTGNDAEYVTAAVAKRPLALKIAGRGPDILLSA
ncbi:hypothetical protein [Pyrobaculum sp.]|uniref:hypothetical protein n=1 Tax=Pyrobaculum sp. TaxID=2004705 RepID=UPI003D12164B